MIKKPMLAAAIKSDKDRTAMEKSLPLLASVKLDGIRALHHPEHGFVSRKFKPIPNDYIRTFIERFCPLHLDGEIITLDKAGNVKPFSELTGDVMRKAGEPDFLYIVFDSFECPSLDFEKRLEYAQLAIDRADNLDKRVRHLDHTLVTTMEEVDAFTTKALDRDYEGGMFRHPDGIYKEGRSTVNQTWLVKMKQFEDAEGVIIGFEERMHNGNEAKKDATGHTERSSCKANMVPMDTMGALILDTEWGELKVGSGFDDDTRKLIWCGQANYLGLTVTFTYQPFGAKDKPRFPIYKGIRDIIDIS